MIDLQIESANITTDISTEHENLLSNGIWSNLYATDI